MRVDRVVLKNFRSHADTDIALELPVTIIHGRNAAGKSSVLDAVHFALLGYCRGTDERGAGVKELIGEHGKASAIGLETTGGDGGCGNIGSHVHANVEITGAGARWHMSGQVLPALAARTAIAATLGFDRDALHACLDVHGFLGLHHSRQKDLLLKALGLDLADMDARYEQAKLDRAGAKKTLSDLKPPAVPPDPGYTEAEIREQLSAVRAELEQLLAERGRSVGAAEQQAAELQALEARLASATSKAAAAKARKEAEKLRESIEHLQRAAAGIDAREKQLLADNQRLCDERTRLEVTLKKWSVADAGPEVRDMAARRDALVAAGDAVQKLAGHCLVSAEIPCSVDARGREALSRHFAGLVAELNKKIAAATEASTAAALERVAAITSEVAGVQKELAEVRAGRSLSSLTEKETELRRADKLIADFEAAAKDSARLEELKKAGAGASLPAKAAEGLDAKIGATRERIAKGEQLAVIARQREAILRAARDTEEHRLAASSLLEKAEADVARYGPGGERLQLIAAAVSPLLEVAGQVVRAMGLPGVEITVDPWRIGIPGRDAELLSTSEQMRLALGLQIALARATGIGMVALDGAEILDADGRAGLAQIAEAGLVEQLIVCTTTDDGFEEPEIPRVQFVRVGAGAPVGVC